MRTRYEINVSQEDIDNGIPKNSSRCVVATAVARAIPDAMHILVDYQTIRFSLPADRKRLIYLTPQAVEDYVIAFDAGDPIQPFRFGLRDPAFETAMRPRTETSKQPESPATARVAVGGGGQIATRTGSRRSLLPSRSFVRTYGGRAMRINQVDSPSIALK